MIDTRYQIFVSSTFSDLLEERQAVTQALLSLDHFPAGMELFPASDDDSWEIIKSVINDSDYYILVIAGKYGSLSAEGISYTEREYDYAIFLGLPVLAFVHEDPGSLPLSRSDVDSELRKKLDAFKKKVKTGHHVKFWKSTDDLKAKVIQAVSAETKRNPREGWVRASYASDPAQLNQLITENAQLKARIADLSSNPPLGAEGLSKGDELVNIDVYAKPSEFDSGEWYSAEISWNQIFYEVGPLLLQECSESRMKQRIDSESGKYNDDVLGLRPSYTYISENSFETIKIQLFALGLIRKSDKKHALSDHSIYWSLTPYGEQVLMQLRAKRSELTLRRKPD